jgi:hypothetical protein
VPELSGFRAGLTDARGVRHAALLNEMDPAWLGALMPAATTPSPAQLVIRLPGSLELSAGMEVGDVSPGICAADYSGSGPPLGYLDSSGGPGAPIPLLRLGQLLRAVGDIPVAVAPDAAWLGVASIRLRLSAGFGLHGYQALQVGDSLRLLLLR